MAIPYGCIMTPHGPKRLSPKAWRKWQIRQHNKRYARRLAAKPREPETPKPDPEAST